MADSRTNDINIILSTMDFPASRDALIQAAQDAGVDEDTYILFQSLADEHYETADDVNREIYRNQEDDDEE